MVLNYKEFGLGFPVVIIHGLYGSSDNWVSFARRLGTNFRVIAVDLRNHGGSPHSDEHTYELMVADVFELFTRLNIGKAHIIGHSMGGRVAMLFNSWHQNMVDKLVIVDIAPMVTDFNNIAYRMVLAEHKRILKSLMALPLETLKSRKQADELLRRRLPHAPLRLFLLKNLRWSSKLGFWWEFNIEVLWANLEGILCGVEISVAPKAQVLLVRGANSIYIADEQVVFMKQVYPLLQVKEIAEAGHWVHAEQPKKFFETVLSFLM